MGHKITAIEPQKRHDERVNIYLDGQFAFGLDAVAAASLKVGDDLSEMAIDRLKAQDDVAKAFEKAVRYLAPRPRSIAEVRTHLQKKEFSAAVIDEVIPRLARYSYVDDRAFAAFWLRNRNQFNPKGAIALRYELKQKGIANDIIDDALAELDPIASAQQAATKKLRSLRGKDANTIRTKLGDYLARRGFDYATVRTIVEEVITDLEREDGFDEE